MNVVKNNIAATRGDCYLLTYVNGIYEVKINTMIGHVGVDLLIKREPCAFSTLFYDVRTKIR